ncbi:MAG: class I SAM-dependent methyltransferase [Bacteroides sp.]|nr:class I SAM-dependent methyltransferase [Bacteroides sp.]MCM1085923.1 class I SAM-dependent methyltransferase [Bacteroides sp.]
MAKKIQTAERVSEEMSDNFVFQRSKLAYCLAAEKLQGKVLEIGTGMGYGARILAPRAAEFHTLDRFRSPLDADLASKVRFRQATVPPVPFENDTFDFVVSFQVIEHIKKDKVLVDEIFRVLKPCGQVILSTPNRSMSLTRNPFHVREYTPQEFRALLASRFTDVTPGGITGNEKIMEYYENNRKGVAAITRFDFLDLQHRLPRQLLQIPYDILNRLNRVRLLRKGNGLVESIAMDDYLYSPDPENCFDLFYTARK